MLMSPPRRSPTRGRARQTRAGGKSSLSQAKGRGVVVVGCRYQVVVVLLLLVGVAVVGWGLGQVGGCRGVVGERCAVELVGRALGRWCQTDLRAGFHKLFLTSNKQLARANTPFIHFSITNQPLCQPWSSLSWPLAAPSAAASFDRATRETTCFAINNIFYATAYPSPAQSFLAKRFCTYPSNTLHAPRNDPSFEVSAKTSSPSTIRILMSKSMEAHSSALSARFLS